MRDYFTIPQMRQARTMMTGLGAMTADQQRDAGAMLNALIGYQSRLRAWKGLGVDSGESMDKVDYSIAQMKTAIASGDWATALSWYKSGISDAEAGISMAQQAVPYTKLTPTQVAAVTQGAPSSGGGFNFKTIAIVAAIGLAAYYFMGSRD